VQQILKEAWNVEGHDMASEVANRWDHLQAWVQGSYPKSEAKPGETVLQAPGA